MGVLHRSSGRPGFGEYLDSSLKGSISNLQKCYLISEFNVNLLRRHKMSERQHYDSYSQVPLLVKNTSSINCGTNKNFRVY